MKQYQRVYWNFKYTFRMSKDLKNRENLRLNKISRERKDLISQCSDRKMAREKIIKKLKQLLKEI